MAYGGRHQTAAVPYRIPLPLVRDDIHFNTAGLFFDRVSLVLGLE